MYRSSSSEVQFESRMIEGGKRPQRESRGYRQPREVLGRREHQCCAGWSGFLLHEASWAGQAHCSRSSSSAEIKLECRNQTLASAIWLRTLSCAEEGRGCVLGLPRKVALPSPCAAKPVGVNQRPMGCPLCVHACLIAQRCACAEVVCTGTFA